MEFDSEIQDPAPFLPGMQSRKVARMGKSINLMQYPYTTSADSEIKVSGRGGDDLTGRPVDVERKISYPRVRIPQTTSIHVHKPRPAGQVRRKGVTRSR